MTWAGLATIGKVCRCGPPSRRCLHPQNFCLSPTLPLMSPSCSPLWGQKKLRKVCVPRCSHFRLREQLRVAIVTLLWLHGTFASQKPDCSTLQDLCLEMSRSTRKISLARSIVDSALIIGYRCVLSPSSRDHLQSPWGPGVSQRHPHECHQ